MSKYRIWIHASEIITGAGIRIKDGRKIQESDLNRIFDGAVVLREHSKGSVIEWVGPTESLPVKYKRFKKTDLKKKRAIIPAFIDCHTHLVFAGDRAQEFAQRCGGMSYEEIAKRGGGISTTVTATRAASEAQLTKLAIKRVKEARAFGIGTLEIKSGYGLNFESELKSLKVAHSLKNAFPRMQFQTTFLGAHAFPKDLSRAEYLDLLLNKMLPYVAQKKLADACDVFVDEGYFTGAEARTLLEMAQSLGLKIKIHADELGNTESASLSAELKCLSADHLLKISKRGIAALASSQTVAVLLPGTAFYLKAQHAPARALIDEGACVALSTDFNPGTSMTLNLPSVMTTAALYLQMSAAEIFAAVTFNAAKALGIQNKYGTLEKGMQTPIAILPFERFEECYYRFAWSTADQKIELSC